MTEYGALYRKYRPQEFAEVLDQEHVVRVLEGAIAKGDIPHALLFSGTRGTGKTTMARIFARAIGTTPVDLYEIDAASNRGIDDIRELKEAVHTLPYESKYKVYIIDEVHMLTEPAFNALLKTLEEPPAHIIFILATTEEDKILDTILSRCQVFRFRSPSRLVLANLVIEVAKKEGFTLKSDVADLIAISADGSFRDALGVIQKVLLASKDTIGDADEVASIIGAPKTALMRQLIKSIHEKNIAGSLEAIAGVANDHVDMKLFSRLLLEHIRAVMLLRHEPAKAETLLAQFGTETKELLTTIATATPATLNSQLLLRLLQASEQIGFSPIPHLPLEIAIVEFLEKK